MALKKKAPTPPRYPLVIETFRPVSFQDEKNLQSEHPLCINGFVRIRRYRIVVEEISESVGVLRDRLQKLWDESDNHHHHDSLVREAKRLEYVLMGDMGNARKGRA